MARRGATHRSCGTDGTSGPVVGLLFCIASAVGLYCVLADSLDFFANVVIALACIAVASISACKMSNDTIRL